MAEPFLDSLKNVVPSLEKATEVSFSLLLTSFVLLADCAALYVHGMNILHLSEVPDVIKPRLAVEAIILVIGFGMLVGIAMPFLLILTNLATINTVGRWWDRFKIWADPDGERHRPDSGDSVTLHALCKKAHASKEGYYWNLFKEADKENKEHQHKVEQTALYAFTVLVFSGVDLHAQFSSGGTSILTQIADGLGLYGYGWLMSCLGCVVMALAFYPMFEDYRPMVYCPELARELEGRRQQKREKDEQFRRELEEQASSTRLPFNNVGRRLGSRNLD